MKTVFTGGGMLNRVYSEKTRAEIEKLAGEKPAVSDIAPCEAEALFTTWGMKSYGEEDIKKLFPNLKYIFYGAGSVQSFALPFIKNGVRVFSAWRANGVPVAEFTVSQIILCGKRYFDIFTGAKGEARGNFGNKIGIIGLGAIGRLVCEKLSEYDLDVFAYDKFTPDEEFEKLGVKRAGLPFIFSNCDIISNHLANNAATRGMLNKDLIMSMKPDAYFINTGRGAQADHNALYEALKAEPKRTALLDVTEPEPLPQDHPLRSLKNAIISPHIAGSTGDEVGRMGEYMCEEFARIINGEPPLYEVTEKMLEVMA